MDIKELEQVIKILKDNGVNEFELVEDGTHIKLTRGMLSQQVVTAPVAGQQVVAQDASAQAQPVVAAAPSGHAPASDDNFFKVESPIVGTFYRKSSPEADSFVQEGDTVKKGDTLCIVEAMKLMNEIEAPCGGKIVKIHITDGQVVEFGELIFSIDSNA